MRCIAGLEDLGWLVWRAARVQWREPWAVLPGIAISVFFLFVYDAGLGGVAALPGMAHMPYLAFVVPVALVSGAIGGAGTAGQLMARDVEGGFWARMRLTPAAPGLIAVAPVVASVIPSAGQAALLLALATALGLQWPGGVAAGLGVLGLAVLWGVGFAGYTVWVALRSRSARTTQAATFVFFPLLFLSDTFLPLSLIRASWLRAVARVNPTTYVFDGMRHWLAPASPLYSSAATAAGALAAGAFAVVAIGLVVREAQRAAAD